ncbi:gamma subclass chorismate mutase AroQ [Promicromonospora sp. NPDC050249]|uniref:gamma subclass chorismate mutase AroQ n=1 Tax=Promicromonospora sp. NPDC050249 TaxID=3154743 RepID=UPI0033FCE0E4
MSTTLDDVTDGAWPYHRRVPLTGLIVDRLLMADDVAAAKFLTGSPIDDPAREQQVLDHVRSRSGTNEVDPETATAFVRDQFTASKLVQQGLFAHWTTHPEEAPTVPPDLDKVRKRLDQLTTRLLQELHDPHPPRDEPIRTCSHVSTDGSLLESLDTLHRHALDVATRSVHRTTRKEQHP